MGGCKDKNWYAGLLFATAIWLVVVPAFSFDVGRDTLEHNVRVPLKVKGVWPDSPLTISGPAVVFEDTAGVTQQIRRLLLPDGTPEGFVSDIETPVCTDTLCALMNIRVFWDLSGGYWGYDTIPGKPLTKNDHLKFDEADYQKLHELLLDEQSILRRRHKDDLFDKERKRVSQVVDAVTGATAKEVKEVVVDGAVYSSYTLYHLVHTQLAPLIREAVRNSLWDTVKDKLSRSERVDERVFFIKELPQDAFADYSDEIMQTILLAVPRDRIYIMKKMPSEMWDDKAVQARVAAMAKDLDVQSLSHLLHELRDTGKLHVESLRALGSQIPDFSLNQLKVYLALLARDAAFSSDARIQDAVRKAFDNPAYRYRTFLEPYVKDM